MTDQNDNQQEIIEDQSEVEMTDDVSVAEEESTVEESVDDEIEAESEEMDVASEDADLEADSDEDADDVEMESYDDDSDELSAAEEEESGEGDDDDESSREPTALELAKQARLDSLRLEAKIEAILFASKSPMKIPELLELLGDEGISEEDVQRTLDLIENFYEGRHGGFRLVYLKRLGYQFQTTQNAGPIMERMFASRPRPISRASLETLAIIAYRQPVTRAEVEFIRGVDAGSIFRTLMERDLVKCVGRKEIVGRPMLFGTTDEFLKVFNLSSIRDLPPLESFQPSTDTVKGAAEALEDGDEPVDVEKYIADNTSGESLEADGATDEDAEAQEGATADQSIESADSIEGATDSEESLVASEEVETEESIDDNDDQSDELSAEEQMDSAPEDLQERVIEGATLARIEDFDDDEHDAAEETTISEQLEEKESIDGQDTASEMDLGAGDSIEKGSGEVDL